MKEKINSLLMFDIVQADLPISDELNKEIKRMVLSFMKKLDNFSNCLSILKNADFKFAETNDIYRTGIIGQFNLTFELAWKAAFVNLEKLLNPKLNEVQNDWA